MALMLFRGAGLAVRKGVVKFLEDLACLPGHFHRQRALGIKPFNFSA
jgi:hypothetical protein